MGLFSKRHGEEILWFMENSKSMKNVQKELKMKPSPTHNGLTLTGSAPNSHQIWCRKLAGETPCGTGVMA
jgi:hypothetical protein